jgi:hypothetical protein
METDATMEIRKLQAQIDNLVTLVAAQERLIEEYKNLVTILRRQA